MRANRKGREIDTSTCKTSQLAPACLHACWHQLAPAAGRHASASPSKGVPSTRVSDSQIFERAQQSCCVRTCTRAGRQSMASRFTGCGADRQTACGIADPLKGGCRGRRRDGISGLQTPAVRLRGVCRVSTAVCLRTTAVGRRDDGATAYRPACSCRTRTSCLLPLTLSRHERSAVTTKVFEKTFFDTKVPSRNLRFHVLFGELAVFPRGAAGWAGEVGAVDGSLTAGGRRGGRRCLRGDYSASAGVRLLSTARVCDSSASGRRGRRRHLHPPSLTHF